MCGLVGVAGATTRNHELAFEMMLELDTTRGHDSTGVFNLKSTGQEKLAKCVGTPWDLFRDYSYKGITDGINRILLGHNRAATKGGVRRNTAHPFEFDNVVGAHNGTLRTWHKLDDHKKFEVDSECLYHHLNSNGIEDTIKNMTGAYALTWYDKQTQELKFIRNDQRPLYYTYDERHDVIMWASEPWMLVVACSECNVKRGDILKFPEMVLHKVKVALNKVGTAPILGEMVTEDLSECLPKTYFPAKSSGNGGTNSHGAAKPQKKVQASWQKNQEAKKQANQLTNKEISIKLKSVVHTSTTSSYIHCEVIGHDGFHARIYEGDKDSFKELSSRLGSVYIGKSRRAVEFKGKVYVLPDQRTLQLSCLPEDIKEPEEDGSDDGDVVLYAGPNNTLLDRQEFLEKTAPGCAWCSSPIKLEDSEDIAWTPGGDVICPDCKDFEEVKDYLEVH